jgi:hypothetical protein
VALAVGLRRAEVIVYWSCAAVAVLPLATILVGIGFSESFIFGAIASALGIGLVGVAALAVTRASRARFTVTDREVEIRNPFRTMVVDRSQADGLLAAGNWIVLQTSDGRRIPVFAISSGMVWTLKKRAAKWNAHFGFDSHQQGRT